jgi:hypothetical protein
VVLIAATPFPPPPPLLSETVSALHLPGPLLVHLRKDPLPLLLPAEEFPTEPLSLLLEPCEEMW